LLHHLQSKNQSLAELCMKQLKIFVFIQNEIQHVFLVKPTFTKHTEVDEIYRKAIKVTIPNLEHWEKLEEYQNE